MSQIARGVHVPDIPCPTLLRGLAELCLYGRIHRMFRPIPPRWPLDYNGIGSQFRCLLLNGAIHCIFRRKWCSERAYRSDHGKWPSWLSKEYLDVAMIGLAGTNACWFVCQNPLYTLIE